MQNDSFPPEAHHYILYYDDLQFVKVIGNGAYGEVWEGIYLPTQKKVAIKKLHTDILDGNMHELYNREVLALSTLKNTFLLPFIGFTTVPPYCIVTKFIPNNSLFNNLHGKENALQLTPTEFNIIAFGIAVGMSYLHANKTIHRDLKSQNVLIDDRKYPIICDFGSSKNTDLSLTMTGQGGTPSYMAPEFLQNEKYDEKVDVYSYGILLWEIITKEYPFEGLAWAQILCVVVVNRQRPPIPDDWEPNLKTLIKRCWAADPHERPTFQEIVYQFNKGDVAIPGTDKYEFEDFLSTHNFSRQCLANYRRHIGSASFDLKKDEFLQVRSEINRSAQFSIHPAIPLPQLKQTAMSYTVSLGPQSPVSQQLKAINFFDTNSSSSAIVGIPLWTPLLQLAMQPNLQISAPLQSLILKLAQRLEVLQGVTRVQNLPQYLTPFTVDLFLYIITLIPSTVDEQMVNALFTLLTTQAADKAGALLAKLIFSPSTPNEILIMISKEFQIIVEGYASKPGGNHILLSLARLDPMKIPNGVIALYTSSKIPKNAVAGYTALFTTNGIPRGFKLDVVCLHVTSNNALLRSASIEFLRRYETKNEALTDVANSLIQAVIDYSDERAFLLLCNVASNEKTGKTLTMAGTIEKWMSSQPIKAPLFLKLFILLIGHSDYAERFSLHKLTVPFIHHVCHHGDTETLLSAVWAMTKLNLNENLAKEFAESGILADICKVFPLLEDQQAVIDKFIPVFETLYQYSENNKVLFCNLTSKLVELVKSGCQSLKSYIHLLAILAKKQITHSTLINDNAIAILNPYCTDSNAKIDVKNIMASLREGGLNIP